MFSSLKSAQPFNIKGLILTSSFAAVFIGSACSNKRNAGDPVIRFVALGDTGVSGEAPFKVALAMAKQCTAAGCDFALLLGNVSDVGVSSATDPLWNSLFERSFEPLGAIPFWGLAGNLDHLGSLSAMIERTSHSLKWRMPAAHYEIPFLPSWLSVYSLDTQSLIDDVGSAYSQEQLRIAKLSMCQQSGWKILAGHHPIYSNGPNGDTQVLKDSLLPLLEECQVQVSLSAHAKGLEQIRSVNSRDFFVLGGGGSELEDIATVPDVDVAEWDQKFVKKSFGFAWFEIRQSSLRAKIIDDSGETLHEVEVLRE